MVYLFSVPAFFILFRETLECAIIISVLYTVLDRVLPKDQHPQAYRALSLQIIGGAVLGLIVSIVIGVIFIIIFYTISKNLWEDSEAIWEGVLALLACIIITVLAISLIRMSNAERKWEEKLEKMAETEVTDMRSKAKKFGLAILTFTVVVREGLESVVFLGGLGSEEALSGIPIAAVVGIITGLLVGYIMYKGGSRLALKLFLLLATILLLFIAAGLLVKATHEFEEITGSEMVLWETECCNEDKNEFWHVMNGLFGWRHEATLGTTIAWFGYWLFAALVWLLFMLKDKRKQDKEDKEGQNVDFSHDSPITQ